MHPQCRHAQLGDVWVDQPSCSRCPKVQDHGSQRHDSMETWMGRWSRKINDGLQFKLLITRMRRWSGKTNETYMIAYVSSYWYGGKLVDLSTPSFY